MREAAASVIQRQAEELKNAHEKMAEMDRQHTQQLAAMRTQAEEKEILHEQEMAPLRMALVQSSDAIVQATTEAEQAAKEHLDKVFEIESEAAAAKERHNADMQDAQARHAAALSQLQAAHVRDTAQLQAAHAQGNEDYDGQLVEATTVIRDLTSEVGALEQLVAKLERNIDRLEYRAMAHRMTGVHQAIVTVKARSFSVWKDVVYRENFTRCAVWAGRVDGLRRCVMTVRGAEHLAVARAFDECKINFMTVRFEDSYARQVENLNNAIKQRSLLEDRFQQAKTRALLSALQRADRQADSAGALSAVETMRIGWSHQVIGGVNHISGAVRMRRVMGVLMSESARLVMGKLVSGWMKYKKHMDDHRHRQVKRMMEQSIALTQLSRAMLRLAKGAARCALQAFRENLARNNLVLEVLHRLKKNLPKYLHWAAQVSLAVFRINWVRSTNKGKMRGVALAMLQSVTIRRNVDEACSQMRHVLSIWRKIWATWKEKLRQLEIMARMTGLIMVHMRGKAGFILHMMRQNFEAHQRAMKQQDAALAQLRKTFIRIHRGEAAAVLDEIKAAWDKHKDTKATRERQRKRRQQGLERLRMMYIKVNKGEAAVLFACMRDNWFWHNADKAKSLERKKAGGQAIQRLFLRFLGGAQAGAVFEWGLNLATHKKRMTSGERGKVAFQRVGVQMVKGFSGLLLQNWKGNWSHWKVVRVHHHHAVMQMSQWLKNTNARLKLAIVWRLKVNLAADKATLVQKSMEADRECLTGEMTVFRQNSAVRLLRIIRQLPWMLAGTRGDAIDAMKSNWYDVNLTLLGEQHASTLSDLQTEHIASMSELELKAAEKLSERENYMRLAIAENRTLLVSKALKLCPQLWHRQLQLHCRQLLKEWFIATGYHLRTESIDLILQHANECAKLAATKQMRNFLFGVATSQCKQVSLTWLSSVRTQARYTAHKQTSFGSGLHHLEYVFHGFIRQNQSICLANWRINRNDNLLEQTTDNLRRLAQQASMSAMHHSRSEMFRQQVVQRVILWRQRVAAAQHYAHLHTQEQEFFYLKFENGFERMHHLLTGIIRYRISRRLLAYWSRRTSTDRLRMGKMSSGYVRANAAVRKILQNRYRRQLHTWHCKVQAFTKFRQKRKQFRGAFSLLEGHIHNVRGKVYLALLRRWGRRAHHHVLQKHEDMLTELHNKQMRITMRNNQEKLQAMHKQLDAQAEMSVKQLTMQYSNYQNREAVVGVHLIARHLVHISRIKAVARLHRWYAAACHTDKARHLIHDQRARDKWLSCQLVRRHVAWRQARGLIIAIASMRIRFLYFKVHNNAITKARKIEKRMKHIIRDVAVVQIDNFMRRRETEKVSSLISRWQHTVQRWQHTAALSDLYKKHVAERDALRIAYQESTDQQLEAQSTLYESAADYEAKQASALLEKKLLQLEQQLEQNNAQHKEELERTWAGHKTALKRVLFRTAMQRTRFFSHELRCHAVRRNISFWRRKTSWQVSCSLQIAQNQISSLKHDGELLEQQVTKLKMRHAILDNLEEREVSVQGKEKELVLLQMNLAKTKLESS